jgi:hypothetical protein
MGLFEENPILLVPFVLVIVAGYDMVKWLVRRTLLAGRGGVSDVRG